MPYVCIHTDFRICAGFLFLNPFYIFFYYLCYLFINLTFNRPQLKIFNFFLVTITVIYVRGAVKTVKGQKSVARVLTCFGIVTVWLFFYRVLTNNIIKVVNFFIKIILIYLIIIYKLLKITEKVHKLSPIFLPMRIHFENFTANLTIKAKS